MALAFCARAPKATQLDTKFTRSTLGSRRRVFLIAPTWPGVHPSASQIATSQSTRVCSSPSHPTASTVSGKRSGRGNSGQNLSVRKPTDRGAGARSRLTVRRRLATRSCERATLERPTPRRSGSRICSCHDLWDCPAADLWLRRRLGILSRSSVSRGVATRLPPRSIRSAARLTSSTLVGFRSPA